MPAIENPPTTELASGDEMSGTVRATRFDPPHEIPRAEAAAANARDASSLSADLLSSLPHDEAVDVAVAAGAVRDAETISAAMVRQFRTQAQQLAVHLESRQRELDHREAKLHTQLARHEAAARSARLWFQEQHRKLQQRQAEWERHEEEIVDRMRSLGGPTAFFDGGHSPDETSQDKLSAIDEEIEFRLREAEFHERSAQLESRYHHSDSLARKLDIRNQHIEAAEARLARSEAELQFARQEFHAECEAHAARVQRERRQWAEERARQETELAARRAELDQRSEQLEKRATAMEQTRDELLQIQRDTLESQLAAEELRAELAGKAPPAAIVQSLARLRNKLTEQYRLQSDELDRHRQTIAKLATDTEQQRRHLAAKQREFEAWVISQQRQIENEAAQLVAREEHLERQQHDRANRQLQWEAERRELEGEIRRLQTHARRLEDAALEQV